VVSGPTKLIGSKTVDPMTQAYPAHRTGWLRCAAEPCPRLTKGPDCSRPLLSEGQPSAPRKSVNTCRRFSDQRALSVWIKVVLIRRFAARLCWHRCACSTLWSRLFMFRFLARGSAGTDVFFTGRAGRGLALSRHNSVEPKIDATTRAEIASLDRIRRSPRLQDAKIHWRRFAQNLCLDGGGCLESDGCFRQRGRGAPRTRYYFF